MTESPVDPVGAACRKLLEMNTLLRQNFAPSPESFRVYNECIDTLIDAGLPADHYRVSKDTKSLEFRSRLEAAIEDFCSPDGRRENKPG